MMKGLIWIVPITLAWVFLPAVHPPQAQAQQYQIQGWPVKKAWGPLRSTYIEPGKRELRMVFEDSAGTIRIVAVEPEAKTAVLLSELKRE